MAEPSSFSEKIEKSGLLDLLNVTFSQKLSDFPNGKIAPIALVFACEKKTDGDAKVDLLVLAHQKDSDIKSEMMHITSENKELVEYTKKVVESFKK